MRSPFAKSLFQKHFLHRLLMPPNSRGFIASFLILAIESAAKAFLVEKEESLVLPLNDYLYHSHNLDHI